MIYLLGFILHDFAKETNENDLVANGTCHNRSSQFLSAPQLDNPDSKKVFLIRLILGTSINLLVKRDREKKFYFSLSGFPEKGRNPENIFTKTTLLRFLIIPNEILVNYLRETG